MYRRGADGRPGGAQARTRFRLRHNLTALLVLAVGWFGAIAPLALMGAILVAHVGMDRSLGYGLKLPTDFKDTHLGRIGR